MSSPATFDVPNGLLGLGTDLYLEILAGMTSVRDVQNFIGLNKITYALLSAKNFFAATHTALADRSGTKAIIVLRLPHVHYLTDPQQTQEEKESVEEVVIDITKEPEITAIDAQRISSMTIQYKNLRIDNNSSFFAHAMIYVDGLGTLRKKLVEFDDLPEIAEKRPLANKWIEDIKLPPSNVKFVKVRSCGNFTMALSVKGELWTRGWNEDGLFTDSEDFVVLKRFQTPDGLYETSLGKSRVKDFVFDAIHVIIIFENGAVWAFGSIQEFAAYAREVPSDGFFEITDSSKCKPRFFDHVCGDVSSKEGQYGIFGTHKVVKYFRKMYAFLTDDGIPIIRYIREIEHKNTYWYTPLDIKKYFGGERIVNMNHHIDDMYITESGRVYTFNIDRITDDLEAALKEPKVMRTLGFDVSRIKSSLLTRHEYCTVFTDDGKFLSLNFEKQDEAPTDVTGPIVEYTKDEKNKNGMVLKWYAQAALSCYFLAE